MAYQRHQLARAKTDEEYDEMLYEIQYNSQMDNYDPPEGED